MTKEQLQKEIEEIAIKIRHNSFATEYKLPEYVNQLLSLIYSHYIPKSEVVEILERLKIDPQGWTYQHSGLIRNLNTKLTKEISKIKGRGNNN